MKLIPLLLFACSLWGQTQTGGLTPKGAVDASGASSTAPYKSGTSLPATCLTDQAYFKTDAAAGQNVHLCTATNTWTQITGSVGQLHSIPFVIDGGGVAIVTGDIKQYPTANFACTINRTDISADQAGSIAIDVWKAAGAIPTSGNKISASAPITLSSAQLNQNGSRTGWTPSVSVGDVFGFNVASASTVTKINGVIWCQ